MWAKSIIICRFFHLISSILPGISGKVLRAFWMALGGIFRYSPTAMTARELEMLYFPGKGTAIFKLLYCFFVILLLTWSMNLAPVEVGLTWEAEMCKLFEFLAVTPSSSLLPSGRMPPFWIP